MKVVGEIYYNGISFGGSSQATLTVASLRDDADRTTVSNHYTLSVTAVLYDPADTGGQMVAVREKLLATGGELRFTGQGVGLLTVNSPGGQYDMKWGPKPRIVAWQPIGSLISKRTSKRIRPTMTS